MEGSEEEVEIEGDLEEEVVVAVEVLVVEEEETEEVEVWEEQALVMQDQVTGSVRSHVAEIPILPGDKSVTSARNPKRSVWLEMVQKEALEAVVDTMEEEVDMTVEEGEALGAEEEVVVMAVAVEVASVEAEEVEDLVVGGVGIEVGLVVVEEAFQLKGGT